MNERTASKVPESVVTYIETPIRSHDDPRMNYGPKMAIPYGFPAPYTRVWFITRGTLTETRVGDLLPDCFGTLRKVVEIFARGQRPDGTPFLCGYVETQRGGRMSMCWGADEVVRTVGLTDWVTSDEASKLDRRMRDILRRMNREVVA